MEWVDINNVVCECHVSRTSGKYPMIFYLIVIILMFLEEGQEEEERGGITAESQHRGNPPVFFMQIIY